MYRLIENGQEGNGRVDRLTATETRRLPEKERIRDEEPNRRDGETKKAKEERHVRRILKLLTILT